MIRKYLKRGFKYVLYDFKPRKVYVHPEIKSPTALFNGKNILITGGGSGIGLEIAKRFSEEGANILITGRREEKLQKACELMKNVFYFVNDIQDINSQIKLLEFAEKKLGTIDILINNAGVSLHEKDFLEVTEDNFDQQFNTNLKGGYFLTQSCIKQSLSNNKQLNIIFITSERGSQCDVLPYGLTKVAVNSLVEGLSCKYYKYGIRINAVAPGVTTSELTKMKKEEDLSADHNKSMRYFVPEEIAETVLFLASNYSMCISGEIIHCNGGNHLNCYWK